MNTPRHRSAPAAPAARGHEFGSRFAGEIRRNVDWYGQLFATAGGLTQGEVRRLGGDVLERTHQWAPALGDEIEALAAGSGLEPELLGALNGRTEILAVCRARAHECTVAVALGADGVPPTAVQTWDWHDGVADGWLAWTIEHPSGRVVHTLTEYGIVGKLGVCSAGLALLLNILRHGEDRAPVGTPVHVIARRVLDEARDVNEALLLIGSAAPSASSAMTIVAVEAAQKTALTVEVWPNGPSFVLPSKEGLLVHTNHFLDPAAAAADREPRLGPDSFFRYEVIRRRLAAGGAGAAATVELLNSHLGGAGAVCCHPAPEAPLGERYATLATVVVDMARCGIDVHRGGPCSYAAPVCDPAATTTKEGAWAHSR